MAMLNFELIARSFVSLDRRLSEHLLVEIAILIVDTLMYKPVGSSIHLITGSDCPVMVVYTVVGFCHFCEYNSKNWSFQLESSFFMYLYHT